jgi:hypothetical protein
MVFWNNKRPITIDLLKRLSIRKLASVLGRVDEYLAFTLQDKPTQKHKLYPYDGQDTPIVKGA